VECAPLLVAQGTYAGDAQLVVSEVLARLKLSWAALVKGSYPCHVDAEPLAAQCHHGGFCGPHQAFRETDRWWLFPVRVIRAWDVREDVDPVRLGIPGEL
jgi:hypothetical protein